MKRTAIADWITIITGPITLLSTIIALFSKEVPPEGVQQNLDSVTIGLLLIRTTIIFLFFFETSLRFPNIITRSGTSSLPNGFVYFLSNVACLVFFIAIQLILLGRTYSSTNNGVVGGLIVIPALFWVFLSAFLLIPHEESKKVK